MATLTVTVNAPAGATPVVDRSFSVSGSVAWSPASMSMTDKVVRVTFGAGGPVVAATFVNDVAWACSGSIGLGVPWGGVFTVSVDATAKHRFVDGEGHQDFDVLHATASLNVRLVQAIAPQLTIAPIASPILAAQLPTTITATGTAMGVQAPILAVQYYLEGALGSIPSVVNTGSNDSTWSVTLPAPPGTHTLTARATDRFGTAIETSRSFTVQAAPPIVIPPGAQATLSGAPTTSSVTSWTRLEPHCTDADMSVSTRARLFDPLWMLTRQWQLGEFQAEDAGTPIQARVRATHAMLSRSFAGELPVPAGGSSAVAATYDPTRTPLEVLAERRSMRAANADDARMLTFAVEAGLHFLRMLELQGLSKSYRAVFISKLALQEPGSSSLPLDDASQRYLRAMQGRAPDGRRLAAILRGTGAAQWVLDAALAIAVADQPKVQQAAQAWLAWYDALYSEPAGPADDAWVAPRLEYALSVGTRLSASAQDDITFTATELDGPIDWSSFDINPQASLTTAADQSVTTSVEATIPAPVSFPGAPAARFWEMEDARLAHGLMSVGPTDLAHLMVIEYASSYGNDWFIVPLDVPVGSVTRVDSLVITDTFGVRSLVRPIGDAALPPANFSMWQSAIRNLPASVAAKNAVNRFLLAPTLARTLDGAPLEDVLFMRDEMANLAWAIERTVESPIEQPARRYEALDAAPASTTPPTPTDTDAGLPHYLLSTAVAPNWIPLLPVRLPNPAQPPNSAGQFLSRLKVGAVLQTDGSKQVHRAMSEVLKAVPGLTLYDEEVPREGIRVTRQRRLGRWSDGSTWVWTSLRAQVGTGEGSSGLAFDQVLEPAGEVQG